MCTGLAGPTVDVDDALMGRRGPLPSSGHHFRGHEVVLRGSVPTIRVERVDPAHAIADRRGYVAIHRLVASEARGRWVSRGEAVVPRDGDPWNWDRWNLDVRPIAAHLPKAPRGRAPAAKATSRGSGRARRRKR